MKLAELVRRLPVVLLWHMHQPQYRDALTGEYVLPWTYLHAIKDYTDMAAHLEANPAARAVVNFTPVLLEQLTELADTVLRHLVSGAGLPDPVLALLGPAPVPAEPLQRLNLLRACLRAQRKQMIERFAPYLELAELAEPLATLERIGYASDRLITDLAVWYHLAWLGETVRRSHPLVARLTERGRDFEPEHRRDLLKLVGELLAEVVPRFKRLAERGQVELSITPYGHPIIPLLLDFRCAREAVPDMPLPAHGSYPGGMLRSAWHVQEGLRVFVQSFGIRPRGCWPAEGAVSRDTLELLEAHGFEWAATSANVLRGSLEATAPDAGSDPLSFNRPYCLAGSRMSCFFRDDALSDLIGFTYATWHGDDAAGNLVESLTRLADSYDASPDHAILIALDGENAWEHYPYNGYYFLQALYASLASHPRLELTTLSACVARGLTPRPIESVRAGSWVHGTLATWMGDPAKNRGWDLLCDAKAAFDFVMASGRLDPKQRAAATRQLGLCESSDWFWWFGDYNPEAAVRQFDELYRRQLQNLYRLLGLTPPDSLSFPISVGGGAAEHGGVMRRGSAAG